MLPSMTTLEADSSRLMSIFSVQLLNRKMLLSKMMMNVFMTMDY
jgi:hypothetical protein